MRWGLAGSSRHSSTLRSMTIAPGTSPCSARWAAERVSTSRAPPAIAAAASRGSSRRSRARARSRSWSIVQVTGLPPQGRTWPQDAHRAEAGQATARQPLLPGSNLCADDADTGVVAVSQDQQAVSERQSRRVAEAAREQDWQLPSFGRELFLGRLRLDLIHPHPRPTEQERRKGEAFLARLEAFLREAVDPLQIERDANIPDKVVRGLAELGALGIKIEERYGGLGLSQLYYNRALALAASAHSSIGVLLSAHQSIGVPEPVRLFGSEEQKRRILPGVARDQLSAFLLTEPEVGSDPARMRTSATPTEDGSAYVLNGSKLWTTNGVIADMLVVMAMVPKSEGHRGGITAFVVDARTPGITVTHRNQFMGLRGIENGVTVFDGVRVPAANRLGEEGRGLKIALQTLNTGRLSLPAHCCAAAKWSLRIARQWCNERVQWGRPIG